VIHSTPNRRRDPRLVRTALAAALLAPIPAIAAPATVNFDIAQGPLGAALVQYARQSGQQLMFDAGLVTGRRTPGLKGALAPEEGLRRLLVGSGITFERTGPRVLVLKLAAQPAAEPAGPAVAMAPQQLSEVVVTGSLIHGSSRGPSPLVQLDRGAIDRSGYGTVSEAIEALPQNFSGTGTPTSALTAADTTGTNTFLSSGVNLRGLGNAATLVLINGRRLAGTGYNGDFADLSTVPTAAVDHVDVLLDGASALYGSDAVGGVVNVILKRDFEGAETRARVGGAAGGATQYQAAQTVGFRWATGSLLASYEFEHQDPLAYSARPYTASGDLRPFGGTDQRFFYASPGNIVVFDPALGAYKVGWAIPAPKDGVALTPGDFLAGQTNPGEPNQGADLLPRTDRHSVYVAARQQVSGRITLSGDVRFSDRTYAYAGTPSLATLRVNTNNPYFVSPNATTSELIAYSFFRDVGSPRAFGRSDNLGLTLGADIDLGGDWKGEVYTAYAQEHAGAQATGIIDPAFLREALGTAPDDPKTSFSAARDGYFNPFGAGAANSRTVLDFINSGYSKVFSQTQVASANAEADGTVFSLPGGPAKLAAGVSFRRETYRQAQYVLHAQDVPTSTLLGPFQRNIAAGFVEARAPVVGAANAIPGIRRLEISAALRAERYDDVGTTVNPKLGVLWSPAEGIGVRFTYGRSFRAPALSEEFMASQIGATFLPAANGSVLALYTVGGNRDLKPEKARTLTAGFDVAPRALPGLTLSATWFDTRFTDRIEQPVLQNLSTALIDPAFGPFVTTIDPNKPSDEALVQALLNDPRYTSPGAFPANAFGAIVNAGFVNSAALRVSGVDISARYAITAGADRIDFEASASHLYRYERQTTAVAPAVSYLDTPGNPTSLRARGSATWTHGDFAVRGALNYVGGYHDLKGARIDPWATADLQVEWRSHTPSGPLEGLTVTASVRNLLDSDPPFYNGPVPLAVGYDPSNADALGRFVSLQVTKRW